MFIGQEDMIKSECIDYLDSARKYLLSKYSFLSDSVFRLDENESLFYGGTSIDDYGHLQRVYVGIKEFVDMSDDGVVSDYEFMIPLIGMFHEVCGHCNQFYGQFRQGDELSQVLVASYLACKCSVNYYGFKQAECGKPTNYFGHPHEIAAQYAGIKYGYMYCCDVFGKDLAERLVCNYVNDRIATDSEFIGYVNGQKYESVCDILDAFNHRFQQSVHDQRMFSQRLLLGVNDTLVSYVVLREDIGMSVSDDIRFVGNTKDGFQQDLWLAQLYLKEEDKNNWLYENLAAVRNLPDVDRSFVRNLRIKYKKRPDVCDFDLAELVDCQTVQAEAHDGFG